MPERIRVHRDRRTRSPEETAIESWVENLGVYLTLPGDDPVRDKTDIGPTARIWRSAAKGRSRGANQR
jgi:hypothetical protein